MAKENISKMKREPTRVKIYLQMILWTRVWSPKYTTNPHDCTPGRHTTQLKNEQRTWTDNSPRRTYWGPRTYERMLSITSHQRHANWNHNEISPHTVDNGHQKQINRQEVMARLWRKGNPSTFLVGMQTGAATVENRMEFPQKAKNGSAFWLDNSAAGIIS